MDRYKHQEKMSRPFCLRYHLYSMCDSVWLVLGWIVVSDIITVAFFTNIHSLPLFTYDFYDGQKPLIRCECISEWSTIIIPMAYFEPTNEPHVSNQPSTSSNIPCVAENLIIFYDRLNSAQSRTLFAKVIMMNGHCQCHCSTMYSQLSSLADKPHTVQFVH